MCLNQRCRSESLVGRGNFVPCEIAHRSRCPPWGRTPPWSGVHVPKSPVRTSLFSSRCTSSRMALIHVEFRTLVATLGCRRPWHHRAGRCTVAGVLSEWGEGRGWTMGRGSLDQRIGSDPSLIKSGPLVNDPATWRACRLGWDLWLSESKTTTRIWRGGAYRFRDGLWTVDLQSEGW
jgi:hypothetical protein